MNLALIIIVIILLIFILLIYLSFKKQNTYLKGSSYTKRVNESEIYNYDNINIKPEAKKIENDYLKYMIKTINNELNKLQIKHNQKFFVVGDVHSSVCQFMLPLVLSGFAHHIANTTNFIDFDFDKKEFIVNVWIPKNDDKRVIYLGDIICRGYNVYSLSLLDKLIDLCQLYSKNIYYTPGNHDVGLLMFFKSQMKHTDYAECLPCIPFFPFEFNEICENIYTIDYIKQLILKFKNAILTCDNIKCVLEFEHEGQGCQSCQSCQSCQLLFSHTIPAPNDDVFNALCRNNEPKINNFKYQVELFNKYMTDYNNKIEFDDDVVKIESVNNVFKYMVKNRGGVANLKTYGLCTFIMLFMNQHVDDAFEFDVNYFNKPNNQIHFIGHTCIPATITIKNIDNNKIIMCDCNTGNNEQSETPICVMIDKHDNITTSQNDLSIIVYCSEKYKNDLYDAYNSYIEHIPNHKSEYFKLINDDLWEYNFYNEIKNMN